MPKCIVSAQQLRWAIVFQSMNIVVTQFLPREAIERRVQRMWIKALGVGGVELAMCI